MSRFDSPVQVVGLFVLATVVSMGLIFLINAETLKRRQGTRLERMGDQERRVMETTDKNGEA